MRRILTGLFLFGLGTQLLASEAEIKKLGGSVRRLGASSDEWEVELHLRPTKVTDDSLAHLATLKKNVVWLNLRGTSITSAGLKHLKGMTNLQRLHLERTKIDDAGIPHLAGLVNLEYLNLYGTEVTDKALEHLKGMKKLKALYVWLTKVTDEGVAKLQSALPKLRIVRGVDLSKLPSKPTTTPSAKPKALKWLVTKSKKLPRSKLGQNITVVFKNSKTTPVKLYWNSYGGQLKLYAQLPPNGTRRQNSYSEAIWLITDLKDNPLGYFVTVPSDENLAVIPK